MWLSGKEFTCQCRRRRRHGFDPWVRKIPWKRAWQPTPVFLPRKCLGQRNPAGYSPWGHSELDMTERLTHTHAVTRALWVLLIGASQVALVVKNLPANARDQMWVPSLSWEDPLEEGMATHSSILAWRIPWAEETDRLQSIGSHRVGHDWSNLALSTQKL